MRSATAQGSSIDSSRAATPGSKKILNVTRGTVVCEETTIADSALRRMRGLLGRTSLPAGEGMLLHPAPSIHTAFMRFPIDVVLLDRHLQVLKIVERLPPWRTASAKRARSVLELAAGEVASVGIEVGDQLATAEGDVVPSEDLSTETEQARLPPDEI